MIDTFSDLLAFWRQSRALLEASTAVPTAEHAALARYAINASRNAIAFADCTDTERAAIAAEIDACAALLAARTQETAS